MAKGKNLIGAWAFLVGVVLALVIGLLGLASVNWTIALVILGIIVGLLNVGGAELKEFMLAGTVLVVISAFGGQTYLGTVPYIGDILQALLSLFIPATVVVALKAVFALAKH